MGQAMGWEQERMCVGEVHYDVVRVTQSQSDKGLDQVGGHVKKTGKGYGWNFKGTVHKELQI